MSAKTTSHHAARLTGFAAAGIWHRRMARVGSASAVAKVQPRLCAELVLHPLPRERSQPNFHDARRTADAVHAA